MGDIKPFPQERARATPLTKEDFTAQVRALLLPQNDFYAEERLLPSDRDKIPPFILQFLPVDLNLSAIITTTGGIIVSIQEERRSELFSAPSISVTAAPDGPLYPSFRNIPGIMVGGIPPEYNSNTVGGRENTMRLAGILLDLAKDKFGK